jgi:hypothetical protein
VVTGIFDAFFARFPIWAFAVALVGGIIAGAAATIRSSTDTIHLPVRQLLENITRRSPTARGDLAKAAVLIILAVLLFIYPLGFVKVLILIVGAWFAYTAVLILLGRLVSSGEEDDDIPPGLLAHFARRSLAMVIAIGVLVAILAVILHLNSGSQTATSASVGCNGSKALCSKRFNEVVFPASHNSMSAAQSGFLNANQGLSIINQLDLGIRGLLIDAYAGRKNDQGIVRTNLAPKEVTAVKAILGKDGLAAVERLAGSVAFGPVDGTKQLYLCHVVCELGATDAASEFQSIKDWMDRNPNEVVVMMIEDAASAELIKQALSDSGLEQMANAFDPRSGAPFPTLEEMTKSGKRLWVMAERNGDPQGWYHRAFAVTQETPYKFASPAQLRSPASCRPGRGGTRPPLFLVNNWIETYPPNPENANKVNTRQFLVDRARQCDQIRNRTANLLAVDFADRGDVVGAAKVLNGSN